MDVQTQELLATFEADCGLSPENSNTNQKRKRLQRLTKQQSEILEGFFSVCGHPDDSQKRHLSGRTGLGLDQVKFWFQNKRTQVKTSCCKEDNYKLTVENEILRDENRYFKIAICYAVCVNCGNKSQQNHLSVVMGRLKGHTDWLQQEITRSHGTLLNANIPSQLDPSAQTVLPGQQDAEMMAELAKNAMHALIIVSQTHVGLWFPVPGCSYDILNMMAYQQAYAGDNGANAMGFKTEATRGDAMVMMDSKSIVDFLMEPYNYRSFFPGAISGAITNRIYTWPTNDGYNGVVQLMTVEMMFPSPLVPVRRCTFLRHCNVVAEGAVVVVDLSLDDGTGFAKCRKLPSGFLIRSLRPNTCKVIAVEHVRVDDSGIHELYQPCLSGLMFGSRRWVVTMARQAARLRDVHLTKSTLKVSTKGRKNLMKLADDLLVSFAGSVAPVGAAGGMWTVLTGAGMEDDIRVAYRCITEGTSTNTTNAVLSACASLRVPLPMSQVFELLRNLTLRSKWDVLVHGSTVKEEVTIAKGAGSDDAVTILHAKRGKGQNKERIMILQNNAYDASGSFMVYSPVDSQLMNTMILAPSDQPSGASNLSLYPTGFSLLPDGEAAKDTTGMDIGEVGGTLMTVGFQIPVKLAGGAGTVVNPRSVASAVRLMDDMITIVKKTLTEDHSAIRGIGPFN
uniref:Homeobox domain-containing protein n=1 Tax=Leersia perrieri TaxID=77586 RepID=A0A0D9V6M4_9ORYZ